MRYTLILSAALIAVAQMAGAIACNYSGQVMVAETTPAAPGECWDLAAWPEADAKSFCKNMPVTEGQVGSQQVTQCPTGSVGKCVGTKYQVPMAQDVPAEYYAKMPAAIAEQVKANLAQMNAQLAHLKRYEGNVTTLYYYADPQGFVKKADQQKDCQNRGGRWQ